MEIGVGLQDSLIAKSDLLTLKYFIMVTKSVTEVVIGSGNIYGYISGYINASELINSKRYFY